MLIDAAAAGEIAVMGQHGHLIGRQPHIKLHGVHAEVNRRRKRNERILRILRTVPAMSFNYDVFHEKFIYQGNLFAKRFPRTLSKKL